MAGQPLVLTPRIVTLAAPSAEVVVADAVVTDAPFLADSSGARDSTQAFRSALAAVSAYGGGTVFVPAGIYRIDGTLSIPVSTTLRGADLTDHTDPNRIGTLLLASFGAGDEAASSFISLSALAWVRDLSIWYPSQGFTDDTVRPYPFTVSFDDNCAGALNLRLYNSYNGIAVRAGSNHYLADVVGTVLHEGLIVGNGYEYSWLSNVHFGNDTWKTAPGSRISNAPESDADRRALDTYTSTHVTGVQLGESDGYNAYNIRVRDAQRDVVVKRVLGDPAALWGVLSRIDGQIDDIDGYAAPDLHFLDVDNVPGAESVSYEFIGFRSAGTTNFANVRGHPFNATGDGLTDDTAAIQAALDATHQMGGGTVYLPQGRYRVTTLTVPTGVELRGPLGGGIHHLVGFSACTLLGYAGKNTTAPASDTALLTLSPGSGIRGFNVSYPEQGYGTPAAPVLPYPFTIRGTGAGVWVENVSVANAYNLIDLASFRCDDHFVSGVQATVFNTGVLVGGGSQGGRLERVMVDRGLLQEFLHLDNLSIDALAQYTRQNTVPFVFGDCNGEVSFGLDSFDVKIGWRMLADRGGCTDSTFFNSISDTTSDSGYLFEGGDNLRFVGLGGGTSSGNSFVSSSSFNGSVDVYGALSWGNAQNRALSGGVFRFHDEGGLTLSKTATASSSVSSSEEPSSAVDGSEFTKWMSATGGTNWITVDLDQPSQIDRWVVRHAGINQEPDELNTSAFTLQVSDDGSTFSDVDPVTASGYWLTDRPVSTRGRFVRLLVTQGTQPGGDGLARIYEFQAHGMEGWQFTNDTEGWVSTTGISSLTVSGGKLEISSSGGQPTIVSADNLNIPTSKFSALRVRLKNNGMATLAKLSFATQADPVFTEAESLTIGPIVSSPEYLDYWFDFAGNARWTGTLRQLQLIPIQGAGEVSIDSIAFEAFNPFGRHPVPPQGSPRKPRVVSR